MYQCFGVLGLGFGVSFSGLSFRSCGLGLDLGP